MAAYLSPGVFVEEVDTGVRSIEAVPTSTAGLVGLTPNDGARTGEAVAIDNWSQFLRIYVREKDQSTPLASAVQGFFLNGGSRCYVVNIGKNGSVADGLNALNLIDEIAIIAAPGQTDPISHRALIDCASSMKDRFAILDAPAVEDVEQLTRVAMVKGGAEEPGKGKQLPAAGPPRDDKGVAAFYYPEIQIVDPLDSSKLIFAPPSGHIAGLYAKTDAARGVHKAPANAPLAGVVGLRRVVSRAEHDVLNPAGVNVIRFFSREGIRVWGARTNAPAASNWRYVNVRRFFNMVEESIAIGTRWVIFEPNDRPLWNDIKRDITNFLTLLHGQGAMAGARPQDAFFVKCDAETNPPEVVDAGQVVVVVGIAPVKPAEFLIIRIGQSAAGTTVEAA